MITTTGCGPLFDAFVAAGLNTKQAMQDLGAIVQNDGIELTDKEIDDWAVDATQRLIKIHNDHLMLINATINSLRSMKQDPVLGYRKNGEPINPIKPGMIATACFISCCKCGAGIRGMGGPLRDALCVPCYQEEQSDASNHPTGA